MGEISMDNVYADSIPYAMMDPNHIGNSKYKGSSIPVGYSKKYSKRHKVTKKNRKLNRKK